MTNAMDSYMSLAGNELVNAARLKAYADNGITPRGFDIMYSGCTGLDAITPCVNSDPPINGYSLPELDPAPWYDPSAPESANFAGLLVTHVTVSAPYNRTVTPNINLGQTIGRLRLEGRTIVVTGWLIGKTCCAAQYGLRWLTTALADQPCAEGGDCGGGELDFLDCCPSIGSSEGDCITTAAGVFVRPSADSEYQRAEDFFRRINGVGVTDGPNVLSCQGSTCGCGCAALTEVEFTLSSSSPYLNTFGTPVLTNQPAPIPCGNNGVCNITWIKNAPADPCPPDAGCPEEPDCLEDPICPIPPLPPSATIPSATCACPPLSSIRLCANVVPVKEWSSGSTLNVDVYSGSSELRNLAIRTWENPTGADCTNETDFPDCNACSTLLISYVPADSHLILSGETRKLFIECNGKTRNAAQNVTNIEGQPFDWPDINCFNACICVDFDCDTTASDATITIVRVDRDL